jgi:hypothetical protein
MAEIFGLTTVRINGTYEVDVKNARWDVKRPTPQFNTPGGVRTATGQEMPSGSFDEVIPKQGARDWRALRNFSVEILDQETRKITVFAALRCNWGSLGGSSDLQGANTSKAVAWVGEEVSKV